MSLSTALLATHDWQALAVLYCFASLFADKSSVKELINTLRHVCYLKANN